MIKHAKQDSDEKALLQSAAERMDSITKEINELKAMSENKQMLEVTTNQISVFVLVLESLSVGSSCRIGFDTGTCLFVCLSCYVHFVCAQGMLGHLRDGRLV